MSIIVRCRRREQLRDVSYLRHFVTGGLGNPTYIGRIWVQDASRATQFKHRENAEREIEFWRENRPGEGGTFVYDLIDGGAA